MADLRIRDFPDDLQRTLKVEAAKRGVPLRTLVIEALKEKAEILVAESPGP